MALSKKKERSRGSNLKQKRQAERLNPITTLRQNGYGADMATYFGMFLSRPTREALHRCQPGVRLPNLRFCEPGFLGHRKTRPNLIKWPCSSPGNTTASAGRTTRDISETREGPVRTRFRFPKNRKEPAVQAMCDIPETRGSLMPRTPS